MLCKHNPNKRCRGNFAHKYWVGDRLLAKCDGEIQVELINIDTQQTVSAGLQDACIEVRRTRVFPTSVWLMYKLCNVKEM